MARAAQRTRATRSYDQQCFRVESNTTFADILAPHNALSDVVIDDEARAALLRPSSCGAGDAGAPTSGMRCAGHIHRHVTGFERTPDRVRGRQMDTVELAVGGPWAGYWKDWVEVTPADLESAVQTPCTDRGCVPDTDRKDIFVGYPVPGLAADGASAWVGGVFAHGLENYHWGWRGLLQCEVTWTTDAPLHAAWGDMEADDSATRQSLLTRACVRWEDDGVPMANFTDSNGTTWEFGDENRWCGDWGTYSWMSLAFSFHCSVNGPHVSEIVPTNEQRDAIVAGLEEVYNDPLPDLLRTSFHDAATYSAAPNTTKGGPQGCMRFEHVHGAAGNAGIQFSIDSVGHAIGCGSIDTVSGFADCPFSMADVLQFAGAWSVAAMGGPDATKTLRWGRVDAPYILCQGEQQLAQPDFNGGHKSGFHALGAGGGAGGVAARLAVTFETSRAYFEVSCAVLCCVVLCCVMLCCVVLCCAVLRCVVLCRVVL